MRGLRGSPALVAVAISSMALGIGVNVTIYSVVREMVLDDLSARQPDRLARVAAEIPYARYRDLRHAGVFQDLAFNVWLNDINWNSGTHGEVAWQMITSANFFDVLGVGASAGRLYSQADEGHPVAVVSYGFWRGRLNGDAHIVGRSLRLNGSLYTVTGVLPRDYRSILGRGVSPEIYVIAATDSAYCHPFGRLRDGLTRGQAREALLAAARNIGGADSRAGSCQRGPFVCVEAGITKRGDFGGCAPR